MDNEPKFIFNSTMAWGLAIIALLVLGAVIYWVVYPAILQREFEANRNSPGFITAGQVEFDDVMADYRRLDVQIQKYQGDPDKVTLVDSFKKQQASDVCEIREIVSRLQAERYPDRLSPSQWDFYREVQDIDC